MNKFAAGVSLGLREHRLGTSWNNASPFQGHTLPHKQIVSREIHGCWPALHAGSICPSYNTAQASLVEKSWAVMNMSKCRMVECDIPTLLACK